MPLITGKGIVYGAAGNVIVGAVTIESANRNLEYGHNFDFKKILDSEGEAISLVGSGEEEEVTVEFITTGDTIQEARDFANQAAKPDLLSKVTLSDFPVEVYNGDWTYSGGARGRLVNDDVFVITLPLRKYPAGLAEPVS